MEKELSICGLLAGRFYSLEPYFWGLSIIDYPKDKINLIFLTNSDNEDFLHILEKRIIELKGYNSIKFIKSKTVRPSANAFIENGVHTAEHADVIARLYNELYSYIETEEFLFLEDDVIAPSNAINGLLPCFNDEKVGYACGTQMNRHTKIDNSVFIWDLIKKRVYPEGDSNNTITYGATDLRKPFGIKEIGLGHFGLTMLKKSVCEQIQKPIFKPNLAIAGALVGCDMVLCIELEELGYKRIANFDVRGLHLDSQNKIH